MIEISPLPWRLHFQSVKPGTRSLAIVAGNDDVVAYIGRLSGRRSDAIKLANATLLLRAPELLAVARESLETVRYLLNHMANLNGATTSLHDLESRLVELLTSIDANTEANQ